MVCQTFRQRVNAGTVRRQKYVGIDPVSHHGIHAIHFLAAKIRPIADNRMAVGSRVHDFHARARVDIRAIKASHQDIAGGGLFHAIRRDRGQVW